MELTSQRQFHVINWIIMVSLVGYVIPVELDREHSKN